MRYFGPIEQTDKSWWLVDGAVRGHFSDDNMQNYSGHAGVVYRERVKENTMVGANAYVDTVNDGQRTYNQASVGVEYEKRNPDNNSYVQAGANHYVPFDDYTNRDRFGELGTAPRRGTDAYVSVGKDYDGYGFRGSVTAFHYNETRHAEPLSGARADLDVEYTRNLPEGMRLHAGLGVRQDTMTGSKPAAEVTFGMTWTLGMNKLRKRDACEVARDGDEEAKIDCTDQVQPAGATVTTKTGQTVPNDVPTRRVSLTPPRRNIAYGTPAVPIEYKRPKTTLELVKRTTGGNGRFTFTSNAPLPMVLTTKNNVAQSGAVDVRPGSYTIRETDIPDGWTFDRVRCVGASGINGTQNGVSLLIQEGDKTVCTFFNTFDTTPPPPAETTFQIIKQVNGATAPASTFTFASSNPQLSAQLSTTGGAQTLASSARTIDPGQFTLQETNIPSGFSLTNIQCENVQTTPISNGVQVTISEGDEGRCTFVNSHTPPPPQTATLRIAKTISTSDARGGVFTFTSSNSDLNTSISVSGAGLTALGPIVEVDPGTYTLTETNLPDHFSLESVSCSGGETNGVSMGVDVTLAAGDDVVCTFTNSYEAPPEVTAPITVRSFLSGIDVVTLPETTFTYTTDFGHTYTMTTPDSGGLPFSQTQATGPALPAGTYRITVDNVSENALLQNVSCDNVIAQNPLINGVEITIDALVNPSCTFSFMFFPTTGANDGPQNTLGVSQKADTVLSTPTSAAPTSASPGAPNPWDKRHIVPLDKAKTQTSCQTTLGHKRFGAISAPGRPSKCAQ
jgi:hypothetical protein